MKLGRISKYENYTKQNVNSQQWNCADYRRLSREDGDKLESDSILSQKKIIDNFLNNNPEIKIADCYVDDGYTGTNFERPAFKKMMEDIKSQKINCIIVKDLSRLGRNYHEMGKYLEVVFPLLNVRFISIVDRIDSYKNPSSLKNATVSFKVVMNDEYCRDTSNKVRSSLTSKRKRGQFIGSFAPYGYKKDPQNKNKLIVDEKSATVVKQIFKYFIEGKSILQISRILSSQGVLNPSDYKKYSDSECFKSLDNKNLWSDRTVRRILQNQVYLGDMVQRKMETVSYKVQVCRAVSKDKHIIVKATHEPIIDETTYNKAQELFKRDTRISPKTNTLSLFAGFIKCADCGRAMVKRTVKQPYKTYNYYNCSTYRKMHQCTKHAIQVEKLEKTVLSVLQKQISLAVEMDEFIEFIDLTAKKRFKESGISKAIEQKKQERISLQNFLNDLYPDYKSNLINKEQYLEFKLSTENKLSVIDISINKLQSELATQQYGLSKENDFIFNFKKHKGLMILNRAIVTELIDMVYIHEGGEIEIKFKFADSYVQALEYIEINNKSLISDTEKNKIIASNNDYKINAATV